MEEHRTLRAWLSQEFNSNPVTLELYVSCHDASSSSQKLLRSFFAVTCSPKCP